MEPQLAIAQTLEQAARESFQLATVDPARARRLAAAIEHSARRAGDWPAVSIAAHTIGVAAKSVDDLAASTAALRTAVTAARRAGSAVLAAEARASLAGTLSLRGRPAQALREVAAALQDLDGVAAAKVRIQQAAILQLFGRYDEAATALRRALPTLRRAGEIEWLTRGLSNRGLLHITRRSFKAAEVDLLAAERLASQDSRYTWTAAHIAQNLGWLAASRGEVMAALGHYDRAEHLYREIGAEVGSLLEARARLLLSVRLVKEARLAADAAVVMHRAQQRQLEIVDAQLFLSTVALVQRDHATAIEAAQQASRGYRRLGRPGDLALARYAKLQGDVAGRPDGATPARARRVAEELADAGWPLPSLEARILAGRLALRRGERTAARRDLGLAARARLTGPADARARAWLAEALLREAEGRRRSAGSAISTGLRILEEYQTTLGATELRAHVSIHRDELAVAGLQMAVEDANPRKVLSFVERGRASALVLRPPRPPEDPELSADLADLRTTMTEIDSRRNEGRSTAELVTHQVRLERAIADRCRRFPAAAGVGRTVPRRISELAAALGGDALVEYVELGELMYAVTLVDGRARLHPLGPTAPVNDSLPALWFALRRLANPGLSASGRAAATTMLRRATQTLDDLLFRPLRSQIGERPLTVVPSASLQSLPWSAVPTCSGRPVSVSPSARLWLMATERNQPATGEGVVVVAGPGLPGARSEADAVAAAYEGSVQLVEGAASAATVLASMDGAALVHIAAHGLLRSDNPFFSALLLADGPLIVYELERLHRAPYHVVLAACEAASPGPVGMDEVLGLASLLMAQGTAALIAPVAPVLDTATVELMVTYHAELRAGRSPAVGLAAAQLEAAADSQAAWAAAAGFICLGAGNRAIPALAGPTAEVR